jgi:hypothetical protein
MVTDAVGFIVVVWSIPLAIVAIGLPIALVVMGLRMVARMIWPGA